MKALVAAAALLDRARMGQRFVEQVGPGEDVAENLGERRQTMPRNIRPMRIAKGHFQTSHSLASPLVEKKVNSARPTRLAAGTKPTPEDRKSTRLNSSHT